MPARASSCEDGRRLSEDSCAPWHRQGGSSSSGGAGRQPPLEEPPLAEPISEESPREEPPLHRPILPVYEGGAPSEEASVASESTYEGAPPSDFELLAGPSEFTNGGSTYPDRSRTPRRRRHTVVSYGRPGGQTPEARRDDAPSQSEVSRRMGGLDPLRREVAGRFPLAALFRCVVAPLASPTEDLVMDLPHGDDDVDGLRRVDQRIEALTRGGLRFYVGITENPSRRWSEHDTGMWEKMVVMLRARDSHVTAGMERLVLQKWLNHPLCQNVAPGGERMSAGSPHHFYILIGRPDGLIRRRPGV